MNANAVARPDPRPGSEFDSAPERGGDTPHVRRRGGDPPDGTTAARIGGLHVLMSVSAAVVGVISYAATVVMAHLLPASEYAAFAAVVTLLATVGVAAGALVPLPLAAAVRTHPPESVARRQAVAFGVAVSLLAAVAAAGALAAIVSSFAGPGVAVAAAAAGAAVLAIAPVWGLLQGRGRYPGYTASAVGQAVLRVSIGAGAAAAGLGAAGALTGFVVAAAVVLAINLRTIRPEWEWRPSMLLVSARWAETGSIAAAQLVLSLLAGLDVVLVAALTAGAPASAAQAAGYQVIAVLTKAPVYIAAGAVLVSYPLLRAGEVARDRLLSAALGSFARLAVPATAMLATAPATLAALVLPAALTGAARELPWLAVAGLGYATLSVAHIALLGVGARRRCVAGLAFAAAVLVAALGLGWCSKGVHGIAVGAAVGSAVAAIGAVGLAASYFPHWERRRLMRAFAMVVAMTAALIAARHAPALWMTLAAVIVLFTLAKALSGPITPNDHDADCSAEPGGHPGQLRVLHLGFEDPAMPGSGGGSMRTHEINRRLAAHHCIDITVLTTRYPGCRDRVQDGVRYVHVGLGPGRTRLGRTLGYIAVLPFRARRLPADLVVEDFFAPISTMAAPTWTRRPTIGVVQWLNAREKARQYHVPVHLLERFGVRRYGRLIAVSTDLAAQLRAMSPHARVTIIGNGVDPAAFITSARTDGKDVVFVGRLEIAQKGVDLLLEAWALAAPRQRGNLVIAGTGPDHERLQHLAVRLGVADRVRFVGWVAGAAKHALLASARLVVVPSRFETFGIVAVEALAAATPVLSFDIPCLREVVPTTCGRTVPAFDVAALADAITDICSNDAWLRVAGPAARAFAAQFDWDRLAAAQARVYRDGAPCRTPCNPASNIPGEKP